MPDFDFVAPERFVAGTVGPPGERVFFLQARQGRLLVAVSLEKQQVSILADRVNDILDEVAAGAASEQSAAAFADDDPLDTPVEDEFRVVAISLAWDPADRSVVIECLDAEPGDEEADADDASFPVTAVSNRLRVRLNPAQARAFARRAQHIVSAGRPPCPFCGGPLDVSGHICPRSNGYRR